ncbi:hypothetical protein PMAYCL1PPCAC_08355 [Pristionchus mayeri]|uniref:RING-type domain-containing protein n=1 Tax=Pristionchus mayeri TaxID=1317129 RepID=A0AAN4ZJJ4_9BILA|nr:hypothetical protein PMAYCL1PPCAC_08355 [Pristionchus mayeri]
MHRAHSRGRKVDCCGERQAGDARVRPAEMEVNHLSFVEKDQLGDNLEVHMLENGTLIYYEEQWKGDMFHSARLYTKLKSTVVEAKLPPGRIGSFATHGNELFILLRWKIYKIVLTPFDVFCVTFLRDQHANESLQRGCLYTVARDRDKYACRLWESPNTDRILIDVSNRKMRGFEFAGVHRKRVYYVNTCEDTNAKVWQESDNVTVVQLPFSRFLRMHVHDSSKFVYFFDATYIYVLNIETIQEIKCLESGGNITHIIGIVNGVIYVRVKHQNTYYIMTAQLPDGYFDNTCEHKIEIKDAETSLKLPTDSSLAPDTFDELVDQCCCAICTEMFDSVKFIPRVLDCGHTFCEQCIVKDKHFMCNVIECPNCSYVTNLVDGKPLPKNFLAISMSEQMMTSNKNAKSPCKECNKKFSSLSLCICIKEDCDMFNQLLCLNCSLDGGHGGHAVKYDEKIKQIRTALRLELDNSFSLLTSIKTALVAKITLLDKTSNAVRKKLSDLNIPSHLVGQIESVSSDQEALEYKEIVKDLEKIITEKCEALTESFNLALNAPELRDFLEYDDGAGDE